MEELNQNIMPTIEQPTQLENQIVAMNAQLNTALNSSTLTVEKVSEAVPTFLETLREGATKYKCLSDLVKAVRPLLIERPELSLTRRQLTLISDYVEIVNDAFVKVEEKIIDFEHSLTGNLQQLISVTKLYHNVLVKIDELRNMDKTQMLARVERIKTLEKLVAQKDQQIRTLMIQNQSPQKVAIRPRTPAERKQTPASSEIISLLEDEPVPQPTKSSTPMDVEKTVNPSMETSTSTPKQVKKLFSLKESPQSQVKPVSIVLKKLKSPEVKSRSPRTSPAGIQKQQSLEKLVAKRLTIAAKKAASLNKQAETSVAGNITPPPEPTLFKPDPVVQQSVKKQKKTPISTKKPKPAPTSTAVHPVVKRSSSVSEPVKRVLENIKAIAPAKKLKVTESSTSFVAQQSATATETNAERRLREVLDKAPRRYCGEDFIPLDTQSTATTVDARQMAIRTGTIKIKTESNVSLSGSEIARNSPVVNRRGSRSISSSTSSTRSEELDDAIELVSAHRLQNKLYMYEKVGHRDFNVIMRDENKRVVSKRRPEFRTFEVPRLELNEILLLLPPCMAIRFVMGEELKGAEVFYPVYADTNLHSSVVSKRFVKPETVTNTRQRVPEEIFKLSWGARGRETKNLVASEETVDISLVSRNLDAVFKFTAYLIDDDQYPTMSNNRLILGRDFLAMFAKSMSGIHTEGHIYFLDPNNRAYKAQFQQKHIS
ncbi:hypothetical protein V9T40_006428 [Parthenolecanium corni]|uniref:Uncharacterized protein n=1 Tax=Parthenolecanium corni TaxID=536013 RepID=A0AAN9TKS2_9HEMI